MEAAKQLHALFPSKDDESVILNCRVIECDDERSLASASTSPDPKIRFICITAGKKRVKIHKIKQEKPAVFNIGKSWALEDVKSIEPLKENGVCVSIGGKPYYWTCDSSHNKIELMFTIVSQCQKLNLKLPRLNGIDEEFLKDQMEISRAKTATVNPGSGVAQNPGAKVGGMTGSVGHPTITTTNQEIPTQIYNNDLDAYLAKELGNKLKNETFKSESGFNMDHLLGGFNWQVNGDAADLEQKLESELQALEAANVHAIIESEEQAENVILQIDVTLDELKTIDAWLLHYTTLLDRMGQDVHSVEVKNKVLQITSFNQKALQQEIDRIVESMKLSEPVGQRLKYESLDDPKGVQNCQHVLKVLMDSIDRVKLDQEVGEICMVKERIELYEGYATTFSVRFTEFVTALIGTQIDTLSKDKTRTTKQTLKITGLDDIQIKFCHYRSLMKWLKSTDTRKQYDLCMTYSHQFGQFYKREVREYLENMKTLHAKRKPGVEEQDYIFTTTQISAASAATTALTAMGSNIMDKGKGLMVEKGKAGWNMLGGGGTTRKKGTTSVIEAESDTLPRRKPVLDADGADEFGSKAEMTPDLYRKGTVKAKTDRPDDDKIWPDEAMIEVYKSLFPMVICEMNFVMDFFNLRKVEGGADENLEFSYEWLESLHTPREKLKELKAQKMLNSLYDSMFDIHDDISSFLEWCLKHDQTFTIGMMIHIEDCIQQLSHSAYVGFVLQMELLMTRLVLNFDRFVDDQIKKIEETKITFRKRQGILPCVRTFPKFVDHMEKCIDTSRSTTQAARNSVSTAYSRIVKAIFDTLELLAMDQTEGAGVKGEKEGSGGKVDDRESLNVHILTIENMHHFHSEIRARKIPGLETYVKAAKVLYDMSMEAYIKILIRKPLGKLLEFFENVETLLKSNAAEEVSFHLHKITLRDVLKRYPGKEIKKGLEQLYKKVEKGFTDEVDRGSLLQVVWRGIQEAFMTNLKRWDELIQLCYPDTGLKVEFTIEDLLGYFSEIAQNH
ncbi:Exocyst complex component 1 [Podochytrium sp. JEL0797]|nr:Exocyst complex component 1 [Podochytrium sp. JEL0797]KAJ3074766.1 Exocyst complex component 1 [Podochytrium sp. JEL0797]